MLLKKAPGQPGMNHEIHTTPRTALLLAQRRLGQIRLEELLYCQAEAADSEAGADTSHTRSTVGSKKSDEPKGRDGGQPQHNRTVRTRKIPCKSRSA